MKFRDLQNLCVQLDDDNSTIQWRLGNDDIIITDSRDNEIYININK